MQNLIKSKGFGLSPLQEILVLYILFQKQLVFFAMSIH